MGPYLLQALVGISPIFLCPFIEEIGLCGLFYGRQFGANFVYCYLKNKNKFDRTIFRILLIPQCLDEIQLEIGLDAFAGNPLKEEQEHYFHNHGLCTVDVTLPQFFKLR